MDLRDLNGMAAQLAPLGFFLQSIERSPRGDFYLEGRTQRAGVVKLTVSDSYLKREMGRDTSLADVIYRSVKRHMEMEGERAST